jgi:serine/threonine-protein phosphatase Stp1
MSQVTERRSGQFFEAHASDEGAVRGENEDAFLARGGEGLWVVADGMGGLDDGQWASRTLARELAEAPLRGDLEHDAATIAEVIRHANFVIFKASTERRNHMGSTAVALLIRGPRFAAVWAGDSRLYLWREGALSQVTTDHTQVQQLVDAGYLTRREAADHPMSHVLARAVGTHAELETETVMGEVRAGDLFLLCSDGLPRVVEDEEIARELGSGNPAEMVRRLIDQALARGAPDNVTVMAIGCADPSGAMGAAMSATAPIFGGAASDAAAATPAAQPAAPASPPPKAAGPPAALVTVVTVLVLAGLGVGGWLLLPRLKPPAPAPSKLVIVPGAVPETGLRQFESALGAVDCSWLQLEKIAPGPGGVDVAITGVAASPAAVQSALMAAAASARVQVADIDLSSIAPPPPGLCPTLNALRPYRAATSQTGQNLTAAQDSFAVMKQADGKEAGRAIVTATPPPQGDFAVLELGSDDSLNVIAPDRQSFQTMAAAGAVVSKVPDAGGYRLQADYAKPGWSSLILLSGQGPFPHALLTQPAGPRTAAWASQLADAARAGGWRAEMAWYNIMTGADLSVIPQTQAASNTTVSAANAIAAARALQQQIRKPVATNAAPAPATNAATAAPTNAAAPPPPAAKTTPPPATPPAKPAREPANGPTNAAKSDAPL